MSWLELRHAIGTNFVAVGTLFGVYTYMMKMTKGSTPHLLGSSPPKGHWTTNRKNETLFWSFSMEKNKLSISIQFVSEALARYTALTYLDAY